MSQSNMQRKELLTQGSKQFEIRVECLSENQETILGTGLFLQFTNNFNQKKQEFCINDE